MKGYTVLKISQELHSKVKAFCLKAGMKIEAFTEKAVLAALGKAK